MSEEWGEFIYRLAFGAFYTHFWAGYGFVQMEKFTCETVHFICEIHHFHTLDLSFTYSFTCESKVLCENILHLYS
jgi:hypothetical protein